MEFMEEYELYSQAMDNAYEFILGNKTLKDIIPELENELFGYPLPFDPTFENGRSADVIDIVIEYFTEREEYEKCAKLLKIKKECQNSKTQTE